MLEEKPAVYCYSNHQFNGRVDIAHIQTLRPGKSEMPHSLTGLAIHDKISTDKITGCS